MTADRARYLARTSEGRVLPFRRRRPDARVLRRHPAVRLAVPLALALVILGVPLATAWWLLTSPRFALREVAYEGGEKVSERWVSEVLRPALGHNLLQLPLARIDSALAVHPWVAATSLSKELPDRLRVRVVERRAAALLRTEEGLYYLDAEGRTIDRFDPLAGAADFLLVSPRARSGTGTPAGALALAAELERRRPEWAAGLSEIEILGGSDYRVHSDGLPFPLLLEAGEWSARADHLDALLPQILARYGSVAAIDLRFSRRIIVQPSGAGSRAGRAADQKGVAG